MRTTDTTHIMDSPHPYDSEIQAPRRLKVLLGCYACDPYRGSEPGMGWNFVSHIAQHHDVHAIVEQHEFKEILTHFSEAHPEAVRNITFHFIPRKHHNILRKIWPPSYYWFYRAWQRKAYKLALVLEKQEKFDLVHQLTIAGFREPGFLWKLPKPFIWGPIGGFSNTPWCLLPCLGCSGFIHYAARNIINNFQKRWGRASRTAAKYAHTILTSSGQSIADIKRFWKRDAVLLNETGPDFVHTPISPTCHQPGQPLQLCWAGEHVHRKALNLLLEALHLCKQPMELHVYGSGKLNKAWKQLSKKLSLDKIVYFHGLAPRSDVIERLKKTHVFCLTSVRDDTTTVVFEALCLGVPVLALNHCGFSDVIDNNSGIKIAINSPRKVIANIASELDYLATHENERRKLAKGTQQRCEQFKWERKMETVNMIYNQALS